MYINTVSNKLHHPQTHSCLSNRPFCGMVLSTWLAAADVILQTQVVTAWFFLFATISQTPSSRFADRPVRNLGSASTALSYWAYPVFYPSDNYADMKSTHTEREADSR